MNEPVEIELADRMDLYFCELKYRDLMEQAAARLAHYADGVNPYWVMIPR